MFRTGHVDNLQAKAEAVGAAQVETQEEPDALMQSASAVVFA